MAQYEVNNVSVETLLTWIKTGVIAIPEIQRPFVWDSTKVRDLVDSLYQGFPIGYIITWQNPNVKLKDGTLSEGKKILIDGQQRIMALTAALVGQKILDQNYKKTEIKISFNPIDEKFEVFNTAIARDIKWIGNISDIFKPSFDSYTFVGKYAEANGVDASTINNVLVKLRAIQNANLGVIQLASQLDIETVTKIFIRINSKGVVLSQADFAMSKISSSAEYHGDLIRKTIDYFCHLMKRPMDLEAIEENDPDFVSTDDFSSIKWITKNTDEIYQPDYTDVLRVAFTSQFMRGRLQDLVSLLSGRNFETREYLASIAEQSFSKLFDGVKKFINTLYLGMPFDDYVENFTNLSGWKYIGHQSISYNAVKENTSEGVLEVVSVMNEPGTKTVNNFCIHFYTNDYNLAENIYKRSVINLFNQLGNSPMSTKNVGLLNAYWIYNTYRDTNKYGYKRTVNNKVFVSLYKQSSQGYDYQVIIGRTQSETYDPR